MDSGKKIAELETLIQELEAKQVVLDECLAQEQRARLRELKQLKKLVC